MILVVMTAIDGFWVMAAFLIAVIAFVLSFVLRTYYQIEGNNLKIVCGFLFRQEIDIMKIRKIEKTVNPISSPALSIRHRIEIFYNTYDSVIISPELQAEFIQTLKLINTNISTNL